MDVSQCLSLILCVFIGIVGADLLPNYKDICASFQYAVAAHLCTRLRRAMEFIEKRELLPDDNRILVSTHFKSRQYPCSLCKSELMKHIYNQNVDRYQLQ